MLGTFELASSGDLDMRLERFEEVHDLRTLDSAVVKTEQEVRAALCGWR